MGNSEKGHWVTVNGKHLFISDDPIEKQEREIADSQKSANKFNQRRQEKADSREIAEKARQARVEKAKKAYPGAYITHQGGVTYVSHRKDKSTKEYVDEYKKAFEKEGIAYFVDERAATANEPIGIIGTFKSWDEAKPQMENDFEWGWFIDKNGKKRLYEYEPG